MGFTVYTSADYEIMQQQALQSLEELNGMTIGGLTLHFDVKGLIETLKKEMPKIPCDFMECYLLQF